MVFFSELLQRNERALRARVAGCVSRSGIRCGRRSRRLHFWSGRFVFSRRGIGRVHADGMISDLLLERRHVGEVEWRRAGQCVLHELRPDWKRGPGTRLFLAERILFIVEADPHTGGDLRREANEPGVRVILRRSGFSCSRPF